MNSEIIDDKRPIYSLQWPDGTFYVANAGDGDKIEAYGEPGQVGEVPWFRVFKAGVVVHRCPAASVDGVSYAE